MLKFIKSTIKLHIYIFKMHYIWALNFLIAFNSHKNNL
jgi:hypothetical protein